MPAHKHTLDSSEAKPTKRAKKGHAGERKLALDELEWKEVDMPDRLDDVEGFFGLEEIEGVDVAVEGGKVEYKLVGRPKRKAREKERQVRGIEEEGEYEEWKGFSDGESEEKTQPKPLKQKQKAKKEKKEKKAQQLAMYTGGNPFDALQAEEEDVDEVDLPGWDSLDLSPPTLRALAKLSFTSPTPIQSSAIPEILEGHDVIGKASTGSGKTLAFGIPILESFLNTNQIPAEEKQRLPMALILSPTRELAKQIHDHITALTAAVPDCNIVTLTGGLSLEKQLRQLEERGGVDVIIATPGRLWEVVSEGRGWIDKLKQGLKFLVVDEADRLLQEGHFKEVEELLDLLAREVEEPEFKEESDNEVGLDDTESKKKGKKPKPKKKAPNSRWQTLIFSATFHQGLQQKLASKGGKKGWAKTRAGDLMDEKASMEYLLKKLSFREQVPKFIDVNPVSQLAERLREGIVECGAMEKDIYLYYLLLRYPCRTLIFTNSISSVKRLSPFLSELNLPACPLHSNMIQKARLRNLERFSSPSNSNSILIATDLAARGLDIKNVEMVIHYHLPRSADMYVHRSGRTARADERGISILLCAPEEVVGVRRLVHKVHHSESAKGTGRYMMKSFDVDRKLVTRLKPRATLAKNISDSSIEKQKKNKEDDWLKTAADELGVEYDSEEFANTKVGKRGVRGKAKREKAVGVDKATVDEWRRELKGLLKQKVNSGFSARYLTSGLVNIAQTMLDGESSHEHILGVEKRRVVDEVSW